jgi:2-polyprenyl-3-methyl-5-hydroxy-6-metoxy-1,4-benzoquinol methylase
MPTKESNWTHFWQTERHAFDGVMRLATQYFADQFCRVFQVQGNVHILDYGCGPGFLADVLMPRGITFSGADINQYFIDLCQQHHPEGNFFGIQADARQNTLVLQQRMTKPADFIVLLSITQYLSSPSELEQIVISLKPYLTSTGSIIVADVVDEQTRSYRDALSLLVHAMKKGKLGAFMRFMHYVLRSEYARIAKTSSLQLIPETFINELSARHGLSCRREAGLTFHPTRKNYILQRHR